MNAEWMDIRCLSLRVVFQKTSLIKIEMISHDLLVENNERGKGFLKYGYTTRNTTDVKKRMYFELIT